MDYHFRAYSFVDRIQFVEPGVSARGSYLIPGALRDFSASVVAEASGQLAAWAVMAASDFKLRPIAGIAGLVEILASVNPGQQLELAAQISSMENDAVSYNATASVEGSPVLRLHDCVGPMMSVDHFDDPQALRDRYSLLCEAGSAPGGFGGVPPLALLNLNNDNGATARATLHVPEDAPFFADHFPRRAVFPGTLLMQFNIQLVEHLAVRLPCTGDSGWNLQNLSDMKFRTFIRPGEVLETEARLAGLNGDSAKILVETRRGTRLVCAATASLVANAER